MSPPRGVIPFLSPIPSTLTSINLAPPSKAVSDQFIYLSWVGTSNCVGNTDSIYTDLVNGFINVQKINEITSEGIFRGKSDFNTFGFDKFNDFNSTLGDVVHILTVGILS
ncbi:homocitrate synthase, mitochondrial precursor [Saccharomyces cerevisiae]|nr:homocitrate synthase, mitochondrial precursor [Saccharomyces cerevisiae]